ncbi:MAG: bacteriohemerythrin [Methylobacter sp.]
MAYPETKINYMSQIQLDWKSNYETGVEEIDFQHHFFVGLINRLSSELSSCTDNYYQSRLIQELTYYAKFHFISEENIMMKHHYPDIECHKELHFQLIDELNSKSVSSPSDLLDFLIKWFITHTVQEDKKFGDFLTSAKTVYQST